MVSRGPWNAQYHRFPAQVEPGGGMEAICIRKRMLVMRISEKSSVCELIDGSVMECRVSCSRLHAPHNVHQQKRISIDVYLFGNALDDLRRHALDFDPSSHPVPIYEYQVHSSIRTSPLHDWNFFGTHPKDAGLIFVE